MLLVVMTLWQVCVVPIWVFLPFVQVLGSPWQVLVLVFPFGRVRIPILPFPPELLAELGLEPAAVAVVAPELDWRRAEHRRKGWRDLAAPGLMRSRGHADP